jgi:Zn-finger protein
MSGKCEHYPCHDMDNLDCRLCYCPFYEYCQTLKNYQRREAEVSGYLLDRSDKGLPPIWACELCEMPHFKEVVDCYNENKDLVDIKELFRRCAAVFRGAAYRQRVWYRAVVKTKNGWVVLKSFPCKGRAKLFLKKFEERHPEGYVDAIEMD